MFIPAFYTVKMNPECEVYCPDIPGFLPSQNCSTHHRKWIDCLNEYHKAKTTAREHDE